MIPVELPDQILYAPLQPWLERGVVTLDALNADAASRGLVTGTGLPLRFESPTADGMSYEARAFQTGLVETRSDNWHDLFGAWIWLAFPKAKAAMNLRHWQAMAEEQGARGLVRDALTQFDECGVVVLCTDVSLWEGIRAHRWREVFVERRADVARHLRFLVFGHGSLDALRTPFVGLCGKALCFQVAELPEAIGDQLVLADELLAGFLLGEAELHPRRWQPLPLLGIPGVTPENEAAEYYEDTRQFRPLSPVQSAPEVRQAIAVSLAESRKVRAP
ncbi:MAG TPA: DUF3025 domain-containing protein [Rhodocyclaceae bacterium]|nr:DUF3025 domain-containing protein [Rhodocyclaceae bacterium]